MSLAKVVDDAAKANSDDSDVDSAPKDMKDNRRGATRLTGPARRRSSGYTSAPGSPAGRTGPPTSSFPISPSLPGSAKGKERAHTEDRPTMSSILVNGEAEPESPPRSAKNDEVEARLTDPYRKRFVHTQSGFKGAWDQDSPVSARGKGQRESWLDVDNWNPIKWIAGNEAEKEADADAVPNNKREGPNEEGTSPTRLKVPARSESPENLEEGEAPKLEPPKPSRIPRSFSLHQMKSASTPTWNRLKALLPQVVPNQNENVAPALMAAPEKRDVDLVHELTYSGLSTLVLRMWYERDPHNERRVPILMQQLKIRVSDSIYPLSSSKAVFRIECSYANGVARWVIYRQLRDFRKLNRHYQIANFYTMSDMKLPEFQSSSISKIHFYRLKREKGSQAARAEFAKMQREVLENYLVGLIRAVMFEASSNRLARFLEVSALFIALAHRGGAQLKAGILRIEPSGAKKDYGRKSTNWIERRKGRWSAVRDSYLVIMKEAGELDIYDVFLLDSEFKVERPTRYYRQGLRAMHLEDDDDELDAPSEPARHRVSRILHLNANEAPIDHENDAAFLRVQERFHRRRYSSRGNKPGRPSDGTESEPGPSAHEGGNGAYETSNHRRMRSRASRARRSSVSTAKSTILGRLRSIRSNKESVRRRNSSTDSASSRSSGSSASSNDIVEPAYRDPSTHVDIMNDKHPIGDEGQVDARRKEKDLSHHTFFIENSQMRLKLVARTERQTNQWIAALERMKSSSYWYGKNRFDSFAPIRLNVAVQWLVDGRDYFWNLSRAIQLAKKVIYIHDWWLSPELYLRRPGKEAYRLDRLLKKRAQEGVMIYVILYKEVSNRTTPTDSNRAKQVLTQLHPNIMVQRSPSHFATGTFYWAHHEKMCVIDETIAFMGGLDACFGRWDTPQHILIDNGEPDGAEGSQIWIGKDYSNPRVMDFHSLDKPEQDMYDRSKVARMPWHDVSLQVVGQPARDLCRHFVQRWNWLLRVKNHSREMPFLLPPPEFKPGELATQGLTGTCEMQICRSVGPWSMGTPNIVECSIQNAYLKAIQMSEHFVYIENQFFITSTIVGDTEVENKIGDALVSRIIRAHRDGTKWRACILIPLLPGFTFPIDHDSASAIRIILECQNRTISRGPHSIFSKLRREGIDPDEYISFFSLRGWGKLPGDVLTTEQVYIHAKLMIVDDRLAIIGSANINERSQRGDRDSELAAVIRDTDLIEGMMAGKPFKVGRFAHTLRVRLMREHLGVDVDALYEEDLEQPESAEPPPAPENVDRWDPDHEQEDISPEQPKLEGRSFSPIKGEASATSRMLRLATSNLHQLFTGAEATAAYGRGEVAQDLGIASEKEHGISGADILEEERRTYGMDGQLEPGFASSKVPTLEEKTVVEKRPKETSGDQPLMAALEQGDMLENGSSHPEPARTGDGELYGAPADAMPGDSESPHARIPNKEDADEIEKASVRARTLLRKHLSVRLGAKNWTIPTPAPVIDPHGFDDPVSDDFFKDVWIAAAVHNTEIYRQVFHAVPDDLVTTWKQYKEFVAHHERLQKPSRTPPETAEKPPAGQVPSEGGNGELGVDMQDSEPHKMTDEQVEKCVDEGVQDHRTSEPSETIKDTESHEPGTPMSWEEVPSSMQVPSSQQQEAQAKKKSAASDDPFEPWERELMEELLNDVKGHLVLYPTRFLEGEDVANNFLFNADRLLPLPIYN